MNKRDSYMQMYVKQKENFNFAAVLKKVSIYF
jgi:hypothetical protein